MTDFSQYHLKAQPILQENLQVVVVGFSTLCSCVIRGRNCEIVFKSKPDQGSPGSWLCEEAVVTLKIPDAPKTPQTYKRFVVAIDSKDDIHQACAKVSEAILRVTGVNKILVKKRPADWHASIEGKSGVWAAGKTHLEAIGELVMNHPEEFGVEVAVS